MKNANGNDHYNRSIILASTLIGAALGYLLFGPRRASLAQDYDQPEDFQVQPGTKPPVLIAPLSPTIH